MMTARARLNSAFEAHGTIGPRCNGVARWARHRVCMKTMLPAAVLAAATIANGATFDGSLPLRCRANRGHDCLPASAQCSPLKRETNIDPVFQINFADQTIHSPYRKSLLHAAHVTRNAESIVMQGTELAFAWSALINKTTGALTVSVADREGAYVVFGQCERATQK
jgi:hypothetical protein